MIVSMVSLTKLEAEDIAGVIGIAVFSGLMLGFLAWAIRRSLRKAEAERVLEGEAYLYDLNALQWLGEIWDRALTLVVSRGRRTTDHPKPRAKSIVTVVKAPKNRYGIGFIDVEDQSGNRYLAVPRTRLRRLKN